MKFISWNVNGIRACVQKGFLDFFKEADADIFCLQETKMQDIISTGIRLSEKDIPEQRFLQKKNRYRLFTGLESKNMIRKAV